MKKSLIYIKMCFVLLLLLACSENDDYEAPDTVVAAFWQNSANQNVQGLRVEVGRSLSFFDLSIGSLTRNWTIQKGSTLLKDGFTQADTLNLKKFAISGAGLTSDSEKINVLFNEPGVSTIRFVSTYPEKVTYFPPTNQARLAESQREASIELEEPIEAVLVDDVWTIDTTFDVQVFDTLAATFTVSLDGEVILEVDANDNPQQSQSNSWKEVVLESGQSLTFTDNSTKGLPNNRQWTLEGVNLDLENLENELKELTVPYFILGDFLAGSIKVNRFTNSVNANLEKLIPLRIKVIPSSAPFNIDENSPQIETNTKISFRTLGETMAFSDQEASFSVMFDNTAKGITDQVISVDNASVNSSDATLIDLVLSERLYQDDSNIRITYSGNTISSTDSRILLSSDGPIVVEKGLANLAQNFLPEAFSSIDETSAWSNARFPNGSEVSFVGGADAFEGTSLKFMNDKVATVAYKFDNVDIPEGMYMFTAVAKANNLTPNDGGQTRSLVELKTSAGEIIVSNPWITFVDGDTPNDISNFVLNEWLPINPKSVTVAAGTVLTDLEMFHQFGSFEVYYDNIKLIKIENRP